MPTKIFTELSVEPSSHLTGGNTGEPAEFLNQAEFVRMLARERKRSERSGRRFVLLLLRSGLFSNAANSNICSRVSEGLQRSVRETDFLGWYAEGSAIGIVFNELGNAETSHIVDVLKSKISAALCARLTTEESERISLSIHVFPDGLGEEGVSGPIDSILFPHLMDSKVKIKAGKRVLDVAGSLLALVVFSPALAAIAVAVKVSSKGPVVFRQVRVGEDGRRFTFLKFRSMYEANDHAIHQEYVKRLIAGSEEELMTGKVFKLTDDPRITSLGKFLRKTSLDELPQLVNVFRGEMSLVGPRPPVPYEYECYKLWHRSRLLGVKPGLTGLWQVGGRSRVGFNEMVRLDLQYARTRSIWLDIKILLRTPAAVLTGNGAY